MVGLGVPVLSAIELIGNAIGINRKKKISADITIEGTHIVLVLNISGEAPERVEVPLDNNVGVPLKALVAEASEGILKYTNDRVLGLYYSNYLRDGEKMIKHAKYRLEKYQGNAEQEAKAYASWALGLIRQKKLDAAEQKIKQGLAIKPIHNLYVAWANIFHAKEDYANAIAMDKKSYALLPPDAPSFTRATGLLNIGVDFSYHDQSDSAIYYYRKSLEWDEKFNITYYNLSYEYLITGDTTRCLDEVEKALAYGYNPKFIPEDPDMAGLLTHPRMKELMLKYGEE
jgi:tetratricopeptide (TPR) repeat protein